MDFKESVPPSVLIGHYGGGVPERYLQSGITNYQKIGRLLAEHGQEISEFPCVLDFGCRGCRVLRNFTNEEVWGCDIDSRAIEYCQKDMPFNFLLNDPEPPISLPDHHFDFIYALSVFTHMPEDINKSWIQEFKRILKRPGYLYLTIATVESAKFYAETQKWFTKEIRKRVEYDRFINGEIDHVFGDNFSFSTRDRFLQMMDGFELLSEGMLHTQLGLLFRLNPSEPQPCDIQPEPPTLAAMGQ